MIEMKINLVEKLKSLGFNFESRYEWVIDRDEYGDAPERTITCMLKNGITEDMKDLIKITTFKSIEYTGSCDFEKAIICLGFCNLKRKEKLQLIDCFNNDIRMLTLSECLYSDKALNNILGKELRAKLFNDFITQIISGMNVVPDVIWDDVLMKDELDILIHFIFQNLNTYNAYVLYYSLDFLKGKIEQEYLQHIEEISTPIVVINNLTRR